ncbi:MAG: hypothetical protein QM642_01210 [Edaphocola sp.]
MNTNIQALFKKIFWAAGIVLLCLMPYLSKDYGQTGDEDVEILYGIDIYNYYAHGDQQALNYDDKGPHQLGQQFYGGFFNLTTEVIHRLFPQWHIVDVRHATSAAMGALLMIFTGLFVYRFANKNWIWGLAGMLAMIFSPRIFGESMNNGKDIPFAFAFIMAMYFFGRIADNYKDKIKLTDCIGLLLGWGFAIGARSSNALLFLGYIFVYAAAKALMDKDFRAFLFNLKDKQVKRTYLYILGSLLVGYFVGLFFWPYGLNGPISNVMATMEEMSNRSTTLRMLFDGETILNQDVPGNYLPKWISISSPLVVIILYVGFFLTLPFKITPDGMAKKLFLIFASLFPVVFIGSRHSSILDSWRHLFFIYPYIVCAAILTLTTLENVLMQKKIRYALYAVPVVGLIPAILWTFREHPNEYVYFNESVGGINGAFGYFETDYYGHSGKASARWVLQQEEGKPHPKKMIVRSNLEGMDYYFRKDTGWVDYGSEYVRWYDRGNKDWDYYISYSRFIPEWQLQNGKWPPAGAAHLVTAGGTPIGFVIKRKDKNDFYAYKQVEQKNFDSAVALYQKHLAVDSSDEYVLVSYAFALLNANKPENLPKAQAALEQAIALNPTLKNAYDMLSYVYYLQHDNAKAELYKNKAGALP